MSDETGTINWPSLVARWRASRAKELRALAAKVRKAYEAPAITASTHPYADDLQRAADIIDAAKPAGERADGPALLTAYRAAVVEHEGAKADQGGRHINPHAIVDDPRDLRLIAAECAEDRAARAILGSLDDVPESAACAAGRRG